MTPETRRPSSGVAEAADGSAARLSSIPVTLARLLYCVLAAAAMALISTGTAAAQECSGPALMLFQQAVYSEEPAPSGELPERGATLGSGRLAFLSEENGCEPRTVTVVALADIARDLAVAVDGRPDSVFILGARCAGYEGEERARCILEPLAYDGSSYSGARYPVGTSPARLVFGDPVGAGKLAGENVTIARIDGVDPSVGVGVDGRPGEAFVAAGACPYERFATEEAEDDLLRCLQGPLWLVFDLERPPAARVGESITAHADRAVAELVEGATVSLAPGQGGADVLPSSLSEALEVGTINVGPDGSVSLPITVPDVETGVYQAIVTCEACGTEYDGQTHFPAGSLAIVAEEGSSGPRVVGIVIGALLFVAIIGSVIAWRRGWLRIGSRKRPQEPDRTQS
jgi:hypothetical protein